MFIRSLSDVTLKITVGQKLKMKLNRGNTHLTVKCILLSKQRANTKGALQKNHDMELKKREKLNDLNFQCFLTARDVALLRAAIGCTSARLSL